MKHFIAAFFAATVVGCGDVPERVFFEQPSDAQLEGVWAGTEEITTDDDLASNGTYGNGGKGFSFPVVLQLDDRNRFSLWTSNFPTSYDDESDRSCSGVYTHSNATLRFFPSEQCRALPLSRFTIGRELGGGISLEARTGNSLDPLATYATVRVRFHLVRE